jgi:hypothetical protein
MLLDSPLVTAVHSRRSEILNEGGTVELLEWI